MPSCCVPYCSSGYNKKCKVNHNKLHFFKFPKDPEMLEKWRRKIKRGDRPLTISDFVCSLHFQNELIILFYETKMPDGTVHRIQRGKAKLKPGAFPTIFPQYPSYLNENFSLRKSPKKRKLKFPKKQKVTDSLSAFIDPLQIPSDTRNTLLPEFDLASFIEDLILPPNWNICSCEDLNCVFFLQFNAEFQEEKKIVISKDTLQIKIFIRDIEIKTEIPRFLKRRSDLPELFTEVDQIKLYHGPEFTP